MLDGTALVLGLRLGSVRVLAETRLFREEEGFCWRTFRVPLEERRS